MSLVLFTTRTCPNCLPVKRELEKHGIEYDNVIVDGQENGMALAIEWGVQAVPTMLVIEDGVMNEPDGRLLGPEKILEYIKGVNGTKMDTCSL